MLSDTSFEIFFPLILNLITVGGYKRRKRLSRLDTYAKDLRELTLNYQTQKLQMDHKNPLNRYGKKCFSQTDEDGITIEILKRIRVVNNQEKKVLYVLLEHHQSQSLFFLLIAEINFL